MLKRTLQIFLGLLFIVFLVKPVFAQEKQVNVYFFWGEGCPHCAHEKPFLEELENKYPTQIKVYGFEVWYNSKNRNLLIEVGEKLAADVSGVPFTVVGSEYVVGYYNDETTGKEIENLVSFCLQNSCPDPVGEILGLAGDGGPSEDPNSPAETPEEEQPLPAEELSEDGSPKQLLPPTINVPLLGEIETKNLSLPLLTVVLGGLDGFNPCAMWTLLFLISLLLGVHDRKRRWILGSAFIVASAAVYFLFMAAWLNLILFVGLISWVRIIIGLVAIGGGIYNLREFLVNKDSGCKVTGEEKRRKIFEKLKTITQSKAFWLALGGIILLAAAVNLVELVCSAGLPVVFTQVLALSNLPAWQYYLYLLLYIFVFMLDDLFVFFAAMITLQMTGVTTRYTRLSHLIGGILMAAIGLLLIFKPQWLMFG